MKKIIYTLAGIVLTTTLMVGCGANTTTGAQSKQTTQSTSTDDGSTKQKNFQRADLEGEVASIDGNKITLKVIKTPERPEGSSQKNASKNADKTNSDVNNKNGQAPKAPENRQVEYTGETKDITIGDGIQIKTMNRGQQGSESKDLTVNDIKVGDTLQITYSDKEKETISNINVRPVINQNGKTNSK
ncbi:hypothetical protein [Clostridium uliginosum]|uniref:DUF5666 domain-containing protein n=1 Tax=Clostridium uliginosum TaxID=119641 RepID=A0A1I1QE23_9CLOT|nr:hypothetical protein [Clostridium uliginosum]SFD20341.1 hypothetical protein SAMN05421842_12466 [Clostridium uliginosum]